MLCEKRKTTMYESFDKYIKYMEMNKDQFPNHVYEFAIDPERHILQSPHSLHDAWLTSFTIQENRNLIRPFEPSPSIELVLLGQMHDRDIVLNYSGIEWYEIGGRKNQYNWGDTYHGDIEAHQVRLEGNSILHEIEFVSESKITVTCKDFTCSEKMHA